MPNNHFDFKDWKKAFQLYYQLKENNDSICLVISMHWATSGYWVEENAKKSIYDNIYKTTDEVKRLEKRVTEAIEKRGDRYGCSLIL